MQFRNIIGQEKAKQQLIRSVQSNRLSHAQLFVGKPGSGHLPLALALAQLVNCDNPSSSDSCGTCASCIKMEKLIHPDLHFSFPVIRKKPSPSPSLSNDWITNWREALTTNPYQSLEDWLERIESGNKQPNISIQECHEIIKRLNFHAFEGKYKILVMWLPEFLGKEGSSLLKLIEEPPDNTLLILVANNHERILNTILSRTQLLKVHALSQSDMEQALIHNKELNETDARQIAKIADGNWNRALRLIEQPDSSYHQWMASYVKHALTGKTIDAIKWSESMAELGKDTQKNWLRYLLKFLNEGLRQTYSGLRSKVLDEKEQVIWEYLDKRLSYDDAVKFIEVVDQSIYHIERNANSKILFLHLALEFETACSQFKNAEPLKTI